MKNKMRSRKGILIWTCAAVLLLALCLAVMIFSGEGEDFPVYISEILASNTGSPNGDGRCADFIEIHNGGIAVAVPGYGNAFDLGKFHSREHSAEIHLGLNLAFGVVKSYPNVLLAVGFGRYF